MPAGVVVRMVTRVLLKLLDYLAPIRSRCHCKKSGCRESTFKEVEGGREPGRGGDYAKRATSPET